MFLTHKSSHHCLFVEWESQRLSDRERELLLLRPGIVVGATSRCRSRVEWEQYECELCVACEVELLVSQQVVRLAPWNPDERGVA